MKIDTTPSGLIRLKEVYNNIILETEEGNRLSVAMRDDTFELIVQRGTDGAVRFRVNMNDYTITRTGVGEQLK